MNLVDRLFNGNSGGGGITPSGTISITENGEGIDVSSYAYADVNVSSGGGGGGDFSIAEVTFVDCNTADGSAYDVICSTMAVEPNTILCSKFSVDNTASKKVSVPLYKDSFYLSVQNFSNVDQSVMPTTVGDIELDLENFAFHIYGNGTITLKGEASL